MRDEERKKKNTTSLVDERNNPCCVKTDRIGQATVESVRAVDKKKKSSSVQLREENQAREKKIDRDAIVTNESIPARKNKEGQECAAISTVNGFLGYDRFYRSKTTAIVRSVASRGRGYVRSGSKSKYPSLGGASPLYVLGSWGMRALHNVPQP